MKNDRLLMFYEEKCDPCVVMESIVDKLERELGAKIDRLEVWYNHNNKKLLDKYAGFATVPFFYNEKTDQKISGETDYETLKSWASLDSPQGETSTKET